MTQTIFKTLAVFVALTLALSDVNLRPIYGVLSVPSDFPDVYDPSVYSNIHGGIVSLIEAGGARVSPIPWDTDNSQLTYLLSSVNGVVIAGDTTKLFTTDLIGKRTATNFLNKVEQILTYVIQMNQKGTYYPLIGLNAGAVAIAGQVSGDLSLIETIIRLEAKGYKISMKDNQSKVFSMIAPNLIQYAEGNTLLSFNNTYAIRNSKFGEDKLLSSFFKVVATYNEDLLDDCVAVAEGVDLPVYLIQFSPEIGRHTVNQNDFTANYFTKSIYSGLTNFFANESRQNANAFENSDAEDENLIYQTVPEFIGPGAARIYFFDQSS